MSSRGETMKLVKDLEKQGFVVERTGSGHWKVTRPGRSGCVVMAFSPKREPGFKTFKLLRELGYERSK